MSTLLTVSLLPDQNTQLMFLLSQNAKLPPTSPQVSKNATQMLDLPSLFSDNCCHVVQRCQIKKPLTHTNVGNVKYVQTCGHCSDVLIHLHLNNAKPLH